MKGKLEDLLGIALVVCVLVVLVILIGIGKLIPRFGRWLNAVGNDLFGDEYPSGYYDYP